MPRPKQHGKVAIIMACEQIQERVESGDWEAAYAFASSVLEMVADHKERTQKTKTTAVKVISRG